MTEDTNPFDDFDFDEIEEVENGQDKHEEVDKEETDDAGQLQKLVDELTLSRKVQKDLERRLKGKEYHELESARENAVEMIDFFNSDELYDEFDERSWSKGKGYHAPNHSYISEKLEGWESGLYFIGAESNMGKSAFASTLTKDLCCHEENNLFGIYFSLDDSRHELIPRIIASEQGIPISACSKPQRFQEKIENNEENAIVFQRYLDKRQEGLEKLKEQASCFRIVDTETPAYPGGPGIRTMEQIREYIQNANQFIRTMDENKRLVVCIDSAHDLNYSDKAYFDDRAKMSEVGKDLKKWTKEFDCIILATTHVRKMNGNRRPDKDDIEFGNVLGYEANAIMMLFNDVSKNGGAAKVYYDDPNNEDVKMPVIEVHFDKNKRSSFKGRAYYFFIPDQSSLTECVDNNAIRRYDSIVYES